MTEGSGLNGKELYLNKEAGTRVAAEFDKMHAQLEALRAQVRGLETDLGMGDCDEGRTWNKTFHAVALGDQVSMVKAIEACMDKVQFFATQARAAQQEFHDVAHRSANSFERLNSHNAYPPVLGGSS